MIGTITACCPAALAPRNTEDASAEMKSSDGDLEDVVNREIDHHLVEAERGAYSTGATATTTGGGGGCTATTRS